MSNFTTKGSTEKPTIPLEEAMNRTNYWRQAVKPLFKDKVEDVPKAVLIKKEDIIDLAKKLESSLELVGVRAYFTLHSIKKVDEITLLLVPVVLEETQSEETGEIEFIYKDVLSEKKVNDGEVVEEEDDDDESTIYDFTDPCPPNNDKTSPLN